MRDGDAMTTAPFRIEAKYLRPGDRITLRGDRYAWTVASITLVDVRGTDCYEIRFVGPVPRKPARYLPNTKVEVVAEGPL